MDKIVDRLWLGNHADVRWIEEGEEDRVTAVLNVAYDLRLTIPPTIRYVQTGLVNRPNHPAFYASAILQLHGLLEEGHSVLCLCCSGKHRSPAVVAGYLVYKGIVESMDDALNLIDSRRTITGRDKLCRHHAAVAVLAHRLRQSNDLLTLPGEPYEPEADDGSEVDSRVAGNDLDSA